MMKGSVFLTPVLLPVLTPVLTPALLPRLLFAALGRLHADGRS